MPSARRLRVFMIAAFAIVFTVLYFTSQVRHSSSSSSDPRTINSFFGKTVNGLDQRRRNGGAQVVMMSGKGSSSSSKSNNNKDNNLKDHDGDGTVDEDDERLARQMAERLKAAEQQAKDQANAKAPLKPDRPSDVVGVGSSANGQTKGEGKGKSKVPMKGAKKGDVDEEEDDEEDGVDNNTEEDKDEEVEKAEEVVLAKILKRSPVVIFSKSYCPFSKRAKGILQDKYTIEPPPHVVELDEHPLGKELQALLAARTGRRTVPNILVNGESIGGSDEIAELDARKTLIDKFKAVGGKKIVAMRERFNGNTPRAAA
ncbi:hypothetical protein F5Y17DRAFT_400218 [Xylariaceae sp. FL0594]|nr:hypothetical protein F5Y17DRAFT_400218 [Xylariaceae sp. FL0594]